MTTSEEEAAIEVLQDAGLAAQPRSVEERDYEFDRLLTGAPEAVKFEEPGQFVQGAVVDKLTRQRRDYDTNDLMWNDDGSPRLDPCVILLTPDDGMVTLYMASWRMAKAVNEAVKASGRRHLERGGTLIVRFTGMGEPVTLKSGKKAKPPKKYEAAYDPPGGSGAAVAAEVNAPELGPPIQSSFASEISAECVGGQNCRDCDSRRCSHECHRASKPPAQMQSGDPDAVPF